MKSNKIPEGIARFIIENLSSVLQLEILLEIYGNPARQVSAASIAKKLRTNEKFAKKELANLLTKELLIEEAQNSEVVYRAAPSGNLSQTLAQLTKLYKSHKTRVIELIFVGTLSDI
jgi:hypothetical protein